MILSEIVDEVLRVIDDARYTETIVKSLINDAVLAVATGRMYTGRFELSPPLPNLYSVDTVATTLGSGIADLPADFNRDVVQVVNASAVSLPIMPSLRRFLKLYPKQTAGAVKECVAQGNRLLYRDIPAEAETLTLHYYKTPPTLTLDSDTPSCIPATLHRALLVGYTCREIFNSIELGLEGPKVDMLNYDAIFQEGLIQLQGFLPEDGNPVYYRDSAISRAK